MEYKKGSLGEPTDESLRRSTMEQPIERYCTVEESVKESFRQVKLMRAGKIPKKSWRTWWERWRGLGIRGKGRCALRGKRNKSR